MRKNKKVPGGLSRY